MSPQPEVLTSPSRSNIASRVLPVVVFCTRSFIDLFSISLRPCVRSDFRISLGHLHLTLVFFARIVRSRARSVLLWMRMLLGTGMLLCYRMHAGPVMVGSLTVAVLFPPIYERGWLTRWPRRDRVVWRCADSRSCGIVLIAVRLLRPVPPIRPWSPLWPPLGWSRIRFVLSLRHYRHRVRSDHCGHCRAVADRIVFHPPYSCRRTMIRRSSAVPDRGHIRWGHAAGESGRCHAGHLAPKDDSCCSYWWFC